MKIVSINEKEKQKKELFEMLQELPKPPKQANLTEDQKVWWYWVGKLLVDTGKFAELDVVHLQNAAIMLDYRNKLIQQINKMNENSNNGIGGLVMVHSTGARQISAEMTALTNTNKEIDKLSSHFGLSIRDRNKLSEVKEADPSQTSLFEEFLKTS